MSLDTIGTAATRSFPEFPLPAEHLPSTPGLVERIRKQLERTGTASIGDVGQREVRTAALAYALTYGARYDVKVYLHCARGLGEAIRAWLEAAGKPGAPFRSDQGAAENLGRFLGDRKILLVLDDSRRATDLRVCRHAMPSAHIIVTTPRDQVFVCYSHHDVAWLKRLWVHLSRAVRQGVSVWADTDIRPGTDWREEIAGALERARVAVLLVSPDFLASEFIREEELPRLLEAARRGGLTVILVHVRACDATKLGDFLAANDPTRPLAALSEAEREEVLVDVSRKILEALAGFRTM